MLAFFLKLIGFLGGANVGNLITGVTDVIKNRDNTEVLNAKTGADLAGRYLTAVAETNKIKAEHQTERQIIWGLFGFALPTMVIWWLALMDGVPWNVNLWVVEFHHVKGSWGIAVPPEFVADFHTIVQSFFIAAPGLAGVAMLGRIFKR